MRLAPGSDTGGRFFAHLPRTRGIANAMSATTQQPGGESITLGAFKGIRNTIAAERLAADELERAQNVDIDDAGQIRRRRGYTLVAAGAHHSLFRRSDGVVLAVKAGALGLVQSDFSHIAVQSGIGADPLAYAQVGTDVYYSSRSASGKLAADNTVSAWGASVSPVEWLSPVVTPTDTLSPVAGKMLGAPPLATSLAYYNGRIYMGVGTMVWATELFMYDYVDKTRTYLPFEEDVTVIGTVRDGIYVGTTAALWFLTGRFGEMRRTKALAYGVLPGSLAYMPADRSERGRTAAEAVLMVMTDRGLCACFDGGVAQNLTQATVVFPTATSAAAMFRQQDGIDQYVGVLDSGGTPTSSAKIGDYVDAEIRRALPGA